MSGTIDLAPDGESLLISFPYREDLVDEVRLIPGRRWDREARVWRVPVLQIELVVGTLRPLGFVLAPEVCGLLPESAPPPRGPEPVLPFPEATPDPAPALTIGLLNERVRQSLRKSFADPVWVIGEVFDYDKAKQRKHVFFSLIEKRPGQSQPWAQAEVALFAAAQERIQAKLRDAGVGLALQDGIEIRALVRVDLYPASGRYQLVLEDLDPTFTLGRMALTREAILAELRARGLHRRNAGLPMPIPPRRVGVLASLDSDGWNDFRQQLAASGFAFAVTCYDVRVQGEALRPTLLAGLRWFAQHRDRYDVLCIVRGGGSRIDLSWFDDREIAFAVATHPLKVVCGIGHERDQSVLDLIAHSEKTPTAVGALLVDGMRAAVAALEDRSRDLATHARSVLALHRAHHARRAQRLGRAVRARVARERHRLDHGWPRLRRSVEVLQQRCRDRLDLAQRGLGRAARLAVERAKSRLAASAERQRLLDPRRVLERGYALVRAAGRVVKSAGDLAPGIALDISFRDGHARAVTTDATREDKTG